MSFRCDHLGPTANQGGYQSAHTGVLVVAQTDVTSPDAPRLPGRFVHEADYQSVHDVDHEEAHHRHPREIPDERSRSRHFPAPHHRMHRRNHSHAHTRDHPVSGSEHDAPHHQVTIEVECLKEQGVDDGEYDPPIMACIMRPAM